MVRGGCCQALTLIWLFRIFACEIHLKCNVNLYCENTKKYNCITGTKSCAGDLYWVLAGQNRVMVVSNCIALIVPSVAWSSNFFAWSFWFDCSNSSIYLRIWWLERKKVDLWQIINKQAMRRYKGINFLIQGCHTLTKVTVPAFPCVLHIY